jgi:UDP-glucose 4-epimerase
MKCVLFGGGGFIGSAIADRLLRDGHTLRIFERPRVEPYRVFDTNEIVEWMTGDMLSSHDVTAAIEGMDAVFHLVSFTLPKSSNDDLVYDVETNLISTVQLLNAMVAQNVKRIIFISSGGTVYGIPKYLPIDEQHPTDPLVSYGITKLTIEKYLLMFQQLHGIKANILRVTNPFGRRQRVETAQGAVTTFLHHALHEQPIEIWGDGSITRDYIYIDDVAEAFSKALGYSGPYSVFNISSGVGTTLNELAGILEDVLNRRVVCRYLNKRPFDVPVSILSNVLAKDELGWIPQVMLRDGITRTVKWMTDQLSNSI